MAGNKKPTHRVCLQPDAEEKYTIEVGAAWEHKAGVLTLILKRGLALTGAAGSRIVLFPIDYEREAERRDSRDRGDRGRDSRDRDRRERGNERGNERGKGNGRATEGDDDIPF